MVVNSYRPIFRAAARNIVFHLVTVSSYVLAICWFDFRYHLEELHFPIPIITVLGTVIGLLVAFRTNSSYARWWEARILWGAIVNDSRSFVRQVLEFSPGDGEDPPSADVRRMALRQVAWCYSLSRSLRKQDAVQDLDGLLSERERTLIAESSNVPNEILLQQSIDLSRQYKAGALELYQFVELERTLKRLTDWMGGCERIRNTPFPISYGTLVHMAIYVFVAFLPFGLVEVPAVGLFCTAVSLSFAFQLIDQVAIFLQDPFNGNPSDTPMLTLSRTIEINIKQMLREEEIPEPMGPVEGVYY